MRSMCLCIWYVCVRCGVCRVCISVCVCGVCMCVVVGTPMCACVEVKEGDSLVLCSIALRQGLSPNLKFAVSDTAGQ